MLCVDFHTHSIASKHALNTVDEMLRRADQSGMEGIAITDHSPGTDNTVFLARNSLGNLNWKDRIAGPDLHFFNVFLSRYQPPEELSTVLFKGIECNILGEGEEAIDLPAGLISNLDLVIASVHPIPPLFKVKSKAHMTERILMALDAPIDILGHPFHKTCESDYDLVVATAVEKNITLELNNSSLRHKKADARLVIRMLELIKKRGGRISLSSDSHAANELGSDECTRALLLEADFPQELIVNRSLTSAIQFVQERKTIRRAWDEKNNI